MFNDLFWALYLIGVLSNAWVLLMLPACAGVLTCLFVAMRNDGTCEAAWGFKAPLRWAIGLSLICALLIILIPSKQTMYMMLGVKMTDNVVNSDFGKKMQKIVDMEVDKYLGQLKGTKTE